MRSFTIFLAATMLLTGCGSLPASLTAQVPTTGPIQQGAQVNLDRKDQFIRVIARSPRDGMTPTQIVQGFLDASASFDGDHAVAREYLTGSANSRWLPGLEVSVYDGAAVVTSSGSSVTLTASQTGRIDEIGRYVVASPGQDLRGSFQLVRDGTQWRIDRLPQGLLLSASDVDRAYRSFAVYFFNPSFSALVPDARMIPVLGPGQGTTLVRYLLDGPNDWLAPAVRTGFPDGVGLNIESVPIDGGVARVDLKSSVLLADDGTREALSQQLVWTLGQLSDVTSVEITAGGKQLVVPGVSSPQPVDAWPKVNPDALPDNSSGYVARSRSVVRLGTATDRAVPGDAGSGAVSFLRFAVDRLSTAVAGIDADGTLWRGAIAQDAPLLALTRGEALAAPVFDADGNIWVVNALTGLTRVDRIGRRAEVDVAGLPAESSLLAAVPSRDGTRCALIVQQGVRTALYVGVIVRSNVGAPMTIADPIRVETRLTEAISVGWAGANSLLVIGSDGAESLQVFDLNLARGSIIGIGAPEAPVMVATAPGLPALVGAADGWIYEYVGSNWRKRTSGTSPAYPN
ncbi:MAG: LpqB family beta-propeller domain-containing protein [Actinomycetes bacterium]